MTTTLSDVKHKCAQRSCTDMYRVSLDISVSEIYTLSNKYYLKNTLTQVVFGLTAVTL